ncbi:hypothetical protein MUK42_08522 [Musa troglodytarum]|uniref:Protein kinase domain-containing protein n=1 Tax=Musa troglodytarum TaxID=320322 RepID=A0A9E7JBD5_9LILI|nr:hypothetical protein MUK42_08522 [Musa troglodytarum]
MAVQGLEGSQPVDLSKHPSGIVPTLQNIVSTVNLDCKLDLKAIALQARNAEYNPKRFAAVIMRIREPKTTALIFASGKMVCTGAKSEHQSKLAARKYARIIQKLGFPAKFKDFKIQNIVGSCDAKFPIRLEGLAYSHGAFCSYEPELFPGLIYRMKQPKIVLLIFVSGKIVITGAKVREETYTAFENIYPVLTEFRKSQQCSQNYHLDLYECTVEMDACGPFLVLVLGLLLPWVMETLALLPAQPIVLKLLSSVTPPSPMRYGPAGSRPGNPSPSRPESLATRPVRLLRKPRATSTMAALALIPGCPSSYRVSSNAKSEFQKVQNPLVNEEEKEGSKLPSNPEEVEDLRGTTATNPLIAFTFDELKTITGNFRQDYVLGGGGFGSVYQGFVTQDLKEGLQPLQVAVKVHDGDSSFQGHREWLDYNAKLSDFGLAKDGPVGDKSHVSTRIMGTYGYAAPEYIMTGHLTAMSDVYSFGVVLLEFLTGRKSLDKSRPVREQTLADWAAPLLAQKKKVLSIVDPRLGGDYPEKAVRKTATLAYHCLDQNPKARPLMRDIVELLEPLQEAVEVPISSIS